MSFFGRAMLSVVFFMLDFVRSVCIMLVAWQLSFDWVVGNDISHVASRFLVIVLAMWLYGSNKEEWLL